MNAGLPDGQPLASAGETQAGREESPVSIGQHAG